MKRRTRIFAGVAAAILTYAGLVALTGRNGYHMGFHHDRYHNRYHHDHHCDNYNGDDNRAGTKQDKDSTNLYNQY